MRDNRRLESKVEQLRRVLKQSNTTVASLQRELRSGESKENERDRLIQSQLEYWKVQYDNQKHLMTVGLAASAGFVALLGGLFGGPAPWGICVVFDAIKEANESAISYKPSDVGNYVATGAIVLIFSGFFVSLISSAIASQQARSMIQHVHLVREGKLLSDIAPDMATRFQRYEKWAFRILLAALLAFGAFFVTDNVLNYLRDASCK